jgi:hypothetical protein
MQWRFATTSWTQVLAARGSPSSESRAALESLCKVYWYPLYAFVRRQGYGRFPPTLSVHRPLRLVNHR